jgi:hypothetical protein
MILKTIFVAALLPASLAWAQDEPPPPPPAPPVTEAPPAAPGPRIELPPEEAPAAPTPGQPLLGTGRRIPIGAYGEAFLVFHGDEAEANLERFVVFFGHQFTDWVRVYAEVEIEDAKEIELEQAYLDFTPWGPRWSLRGGLMLVPLGIINQLHEPPTFNGVERPEIDKVILPSTWREIGAGIWAEPTPGLHLQLYLMSGLDATKITPEQGLQPARGQGSEVEPADVAVTGRIDWTRWSGIDLGAGLYWGKAGRENPGLGGVGIGIAEIDGRYKRRGLELRLEYARVFVEDAEAVTNFLRMTDGAAPAVASAMQGLLVEAGYDLMRIARPQSGHEVVLFGRYELVDLRASLPSVLNPVTGEAEHFVSAGLTWRPHPQLALKTDYRHGFDVEGEDEDRLSFGLGFMY